MNSGNSTEVSEDTDAGARHELELETKGRYGTLKYRGCRQRHPEERRSYHDVVSSECCCDHRRRLELQELEREPRRRTKSQVRRYVPCNYPHEAWKHLIERSNYPNSMNDALNNYEHYLTNFTNRTPKKSQHLYPCNPHLRKRQISVHRRPRRNEHDQVTLSIMRNPIDSDGEARPCWEYEHPVKNIHSRDVEEIAEQSNDPKNYQMTRILGNLNVTKHVLENCTQQKKERALRPEAWISKQGVDKASKLDANGRKPLSDDEDRDFCRGKLRFDLPDCENVEEDRENQTKRKPNALPNKPFAMKGNLKNSSLQNLPRNKNIDDLFKQKNLTIERSQEEAAHKETEDRCANKPRKQPNVRQSCRLSEELACSNRKEGREGAPYDLMAKDEEEEENSIKKNIYAGGDLELHATKSHILGLIDRAISNEFGNLSDQQQSLDSNRGLTGQEICIEIMRVLQSNCCPSLAEDTLAHRESSADCIKLLKMLRWDHMTHIQEEFRKLCSLQKFLDTYSPRQTLPVFQSYPVAVEQQRPEERQQPQHEEKQNSGTI
nr:uncharacterized protein LOC117604825 isoform X1 [Osmia lignaria]